MNAKADGWRFDKEQDIADIRIIPHNVIKYKGKSRLYSGETWPTTT